jgi:Rieske Fe-S protein
MATGAIVAGALPGCGGMAQLDGEVRVALGSYPSLAARGGIATIPPSASGFRFDIIVRRTGDQDFIAMSAECPHASCTATPRASDIYCGCHGSRFDLEGTWLEGPANESLLRFNARLDGEELVISS